ncbi:hypothetical protein [Marilutibacter maris]|nr:hypothetical protein [Lysobacter maris]
MTIDNAPGLDIHLDDLSLDRLIMHVARASRFSDAWAGFATTEPHELFCDRFSRRVADTYLARVLSYDDADRAMNGLYAYCHHLDTDRGMPDYAWAVFTAFEAGEYVHEGDGPDTHADEKYVRPLLLKLQA